MTTLIVGVVALVEHTGGRPTSAGVRTQSERPGIRTSAHRSTARSSTDQAEAGQTRAGQPSSASTTVTTSGAGALPQTGAFPSSASPQFSEEMTALWSGVASGVPARALPAFFPEGAYLQLKAIPDPADDWTGRLEAGYYLDIAAAHHLLGPDFAKARLVSVAVPAAAAHWVAPGVCSNQAGYFEVPNARVVYQVGSKIRSFGIASLISWRGQWYVVHLGAVVESPGVPVVDAPADGPGSSAPSLTC